jgi:hypothetical protein
MPTRARVERLLDMCHTYETAARELKLPAGLVFMIETGVTEARLYGENPNDGVGGDGAFFLLLDEPEVYGMPPDPVVTTRDLPQMWRDVAVAAGALLAAAVLSFAGARR